jgi:long-chain acyl-CoA synthetase
MTRPFTTVPGILQHAVCDLPLQRALSWLRDGSWHHLSTAALRDLVRRTALGLHAFGLNPGDRVALLGPSSPQWLIADRAILAAGGVSVPVYRDCCPETFRHQLADAGVAICYVLDDAQLPLVLEHRDHLQGIIAADDVAIPSATVAVREGELRDKGATEMTLNPLAYAHLREKVRSQDLATIIYTSGSTGLPKGVRLSHANLVFQVQAAGRCFPLQSGTDVALSCLPLAHVFERMVAYLYLSLGVSISFCDSIDSLGRCLQEVRPTVMTMVPRLLSKIHQGLRMRAAESHGLRGRLLRHALARAEADRHSLVGRLLVYPQISQRFGGRLQMAIVGGALCPEAEERFFRRVGLQIFIGYGCTEAAPVITCNHPGNHQIGTVGPPLPGVAVRIDEHGEILARGPGIMQGYHNLPQATAAAIDDQGWLHTGDLGAWRDGFVVITGRAKELLKTAGGKYVTPVPIEQALERHAAIDLALVIAEGRQHVAALLFHPPGLEPHAEHTAAVEAHIAEVNRHLDHWQQIHSWAWAGTPPTPQDGGLTPTHKLRRSILRQRHATLIDSLYGEAVPVEGL